MVIYHNDYMFGNKEKKINYIKNVACIQEKNWRIALLYLI